MTDPDPNREIFGYTSHIPVPTWVEKNAYNACKQCSTKFSSMKEATKQHHCRLCGEMFCGNCTGKYHIPLEYERKGKLGATRVCIGCRDSCLAEREKEFAASSASKRHVLHAEDLDSTDMQKRSSASPSHSSTMEIRPPDHWEDVATYKSCGKCHKKGSGRPHNCRCCGQLYCEDCSTKRQLPKGFERKAKSGPSRVCHICNFKILGGAKLIGVDEDESAGSMSETGRCMAPGCIGNRVSKAGYCAAHIREYGGGGSTMDLASQSSITIRWEGETSAVTKVPITSPDMSLLQIDVALRLQVPSLRPTEYEYMYKNEPIHWVFYDVFTASTFASAQQRHELIIRKRIDTNMLMAQYVQSGSNAAGGKNASMSGPPSLMRPTSVAAQIGGVPNPFKRKVENNAEEKVEQPPPKKPAKQLVFQRPALKNLQSSSASSNGHAHAMPPLPALPPLPAVPGAGATSTSSSAAAAPIGPLGPELLKARAKQYFGSI